MSSDCEVFMLKWCSILFIIFGLLTRSWSRMISQKELFCENAAIKSWHQATRICSCLELLTSSGFRCKPHKSAGPG